MHFVRKKNLQRQWQEIFTLHGTSTPYWKAIHFFKINRCLFKIFFLHNDKALKNTLSLLTGHFDARKKTERFKIILPVIFEAILFHGANLKIIKARLFKTSKFLARHCVKNSDVNLLGDNAKNKSIQALQCRSNLLSGTLSSGILSPIND